MPFCALPWNYMNLQILSLPPPLGSFIISAHLTGGDCALAQAGFDLTRYEERFAADRNLPIPPAQRQAVKKRRAEYLASCWLAREVMRSLGIPNFLYFLLQNYSDRSPIWPSGIWAYCRTPTARWRWPGRASRLCRESVMS